MKQLKDYDIDEVAVWLNCIGLGAKVGPFRENAVDGDMLVTLTKEDLTGDLGLTNLQAKKVKTMIESTNEITSKSDSSNDELQAKVNNLSAENDKLRKENKSLHQEIARLKSPPPQKAAPAQPQQQQQQQYRRNQQHYVMNGAARGAARGAVRGAIVGAIVSGRDAGEMAKAGAAAGAATGAMGGIRDRRRARRARLLR